MEVNPNVMDPYDILDLDTDYILQEDCLDYFQNLPSGVRFRPTEEELISSYLKPKLFNQPLPRNEIIEANIYQHNPKILTEIYQKKDNRENKLYFFTPRQRKYRNGDRPNRSTGDGYWKATGADKTITDARNNVIGFKKSLVFYKGKPPGGRKSHWIMHEYRVNDPPRRKRTSADDMRLDDNVLCMIYYKDTRKAKTITGTDEEDPSNSNPTSVESTTSSDHLVSSASNPTSVESTPSHDIDVHLPVQNCMQQQQPLQNAPGIDDGFVDYMSLKWTDHWNFLDMPATRRYHHPFKGDTNRAENSDNHDQKLKGGGVDQQYIYPNDGCQKGFGMYNSNDEFVEKVFNDKPVEDDSPSSNLLLPK